MLKIDLLPPRVPRTRANKKLLAALGLLLILALLGNGFMLLNLDTKLKGAKADLEDAQKRANVVRDVEKKTGEISGRLKPIADKVKFIRQADECGYPYWDRFYEIAEYIYGGAELHMFGIMAQGAGGLVGEGDPEALYHVSGPSGTDCGFAVTVKNPNECGRFILNLIRCPELSEIRISGDLPDGRLVMASWPQILLEWNLPPISLPFSTSQLQGLQLPGVGGGGMGGGMGGEGMAGGMPGEGMGGGMPGEGAGGPGMMGGGPGGGGGMGGMMGGGQGVTGLMPQPRLDESIDLLVTCQLNRPVRVPSPPGVGAGAAAPGAAPGGPGAPGAMPGEMPGGPPGGGMPGEAAGGPPGGGPPGGAPGAGDEEEAVEDEE